MSSTKICPRPLDFRKLYDRTYNNNGNKYTVNTVYRWILDKTEIQQYKMENLLDLELNFTRKPYE